MKSTELFTKHSFENDIRFSGDGDVTVGVRSIPTAHMGDVSGHLTHLSQQELPTQQTDPHSKGKLRIISANKLSWLFF